MNENKLGIIISKLRKEKGLTQKDLADKLNISDKAVSRWETGGSSPNLDMLVTISKFFNIPFNDLLTARVSNEDNGDDIVHEIIEEFTEINKKNSKRIKVVILTAITIILLLAITIIFTHTYNRFKVYKVDIGNEDFNSITGVYIETKIKDTLYLENIKIRDYKLKESDTISVDLYILDGKKEKILQSYSSLDNILFSNYQSYIEIDDLSNYFDNLYIRVTIIDDKGKAKEYVSKIKFILDFSNNKIFYNDIHEIDNSDKTINLTVEEINVILLENGFENTEYDYLQKITKNFKIYYINDSNKISYNYEKDNLSYKYIYYLNTDVLAVSVFAKNTTTEIENYRYDVGNNKMIECITGSCNDYKYVMKLLNKNVLNLLYDK